MNKQHYLGMYDVSEDTVRNRVFAVLSAFGIHRQKSVFECYLSLEQKKQLLNQLDAATQDSPKRVILCKIFPKHGYSKLLGEAKHNIEMDALFIN